MNESDQYILPFPPVVRIEPAASCNFKCIHCPTGLDMTPTGVMSLEMFEKIAMNLEEIITEREKRLDTTGRRDYPESPLFRVIVLYHGGEPLLNKNFIAMVRRSKQLAKFVKTVTNGSRLDDKTIEEIINSGLDHIEISLDGVSAEENDFIRANPLNMTYDVISERIKRLIKQRNEHGLSLPRVSISNTQIPETTADVMKDPQPPQHMLEMFKEVSSDVHYNPNWALVWPGMPLKIHGKPDFNHCDHVINTISIRSNGDVVPCCYDLVSKMPMGNINEKGLQEIWNSKRYQNMRKAIDKFSPPELCKGCPVLYKFKPMVKSDIFKEK